MDGGNVVVIDAYTPLTDLQNTKQWQGQRWFAAATTTTNANLDKPEYEYAEGFKGLKRDFKKLKKKLPPK